ncbi:MAG: universal stress protein [Gammaproteobacteria bacterium]|nr:universal stress protein [Gammaproteobacteria bacterium]
MDDIRTICVILDRPGSEQWALERGKALAAATGAHLHLASFCWVALAENEQVFDTHQRLALQKGALNERRRWLDGVVLDAGLTAANVSTEVVWTKDISVWVAEQAASGKADLVVKSVHRSSGTLLHTPLDWQILRTVHAPVWFATGTSAARGILATIDLEHRDDKHQLMNQRVLDAARYFSGVLDAPAHSVHVVETTGFPDSLEGYEVEVLAADAELRSRELLEALVKPYGVEPANVHLAVGHLGPALAEVTRSKAVDVLVVGTGARGRIGTFLLGNSAEFILASAPCDVLAIHV